jgi:hypothetical protein
MERMTEPLFGLLTALLMWWFLGDVLDNFNDVFLGVILFGSALSFTVTWAYDLLDLLHSGGNDSRSAD